MTATELRKRIYTVLDTVLETGVAQEVHRNGQKLLIIPAAPKRRSLENAPKRNVMNCSFDELVATTWDGSWSPDE